MVEKLRASDLFSFQEDSVFLSSEIVAVTTARKGYSSRQLR
jgi:hypothetical protein